MDVIKTFTTASGKTGSVTKRVKRLGHGTQELITYTVTVNGTPVCEESFNKILDIDCILTPTQRHNWRTTIKTSNAEKEANALRKIDASVKYRMRL